MKNEEKMYQNPVLEKLTATTPRMMIPFHLVIASVLYTMAI